MQINPTLRNCPTDISVGPSVPGKLSLKSFWGSDLSSWASPPSRQQPQVWLGHVDSPPWPPLCGRRTAHRLTPGHDCWPLGANDRGSLGFTAYPYAVVHAGSFVPLRNNYVAHSLRACASTFAAYYLQCAT